MEKGIGGLLTLVATVAMISSVAIVSASEPSGFGGRPEGQFNGGGQGAPAFGAPGQRPESTAEAPADSHLDRTQVESPDNHPP